MTVPRAEATATLLRDGRVLVAGGVLDTEDHALASAELYDPATGTWTATGSMRTPRDRHTATLLPDGRVLVAGGNCPSLTTKGCPTLIDPDGAIAAAELYDPVTGKWTPTGPMTTERFLHSATLLKDGRVLVVGAEHQSGILASAELYDPATGTWAATASMSTPRTQQLTALLADGRVLVAGGIGPVSPGVHDLLASSEVYDPKAGIWSRAGNLATPRAFGGTATLLGDGQVLITGGDGPGDPVLGSSELFDPATSAWTSTGNLITARDVLGSALLRDGRVLVAGGFDSGGPLAAAEVYVPGDHAWTSAAALPSPTIGPAFVVLADGRVLACGGDGGNGAVPNAELFIVTG